MRFVERSVTCRQCVEGDLFKVRYVLSVGSIKSGVSARPYELSVSLRAHVAQLRSAYPYCFKYEVRIIHLEVVDAMLSEETELPRHLRFMSSSDLVKKLRPT